MEARPIRSMTGFASVRAHTAAGELTVSLRSVNGRNLDLHFHIGAEFAPFENAMRGVLKRSFGRGHIEIRMFLAAEAGSAPAAYNRELLGRYLDAFRDASETFGLSAVPDLNKLFTLPGIFETSLTSTGTEVGDEEVENALKRCAEDLNAFREREGAELAKAIDAQLEQIETAWSELTRIRAAATEELAARLRQRLGELLGDSDLPHARLVEETAILVDRSDIQEELTRLSVHTAEVRRTLAAGGEAGKRLDFLLQEMNRETNTILSKTSGIGETGLSVTNLGIGLKANIEKIREQALNLE